MYGKNTSENTTDRLTVHLNGEPVYDIVMTQDFNGLQEEVRKHVSASGKLCIVTDSTVSELYLREVAEILSSCCSSVISYVFPAGEAHKNLSTVQKLYERLILERFDRSDMLVALGRGRGRSLRLCRRHLSARNFFYPDSNHPALPGGQQYRRKNRR